MKRKKEGEKVLKKAEKATSKNDWELKNYILGHIHIRICSNIYCKKHYFNYNFMKGATKMISAAYINNGCVDSFFEKAFEQYDKEVFSLMHDANNSYVELRINTDLIMLESEIMGELENSQTTILEAEGQNFVKKIGQTIISLFESFVKFVDSIVQKVKDFNFRLKSNEKKMNSLVKNHPELTKEKIQLLADEGGLDFSDFKSLAELDKEFFQIVEMSKKADVKPDSLKGRW